MTRIMNLTDIRRILTGMDPIPAQEEGFAAYFRGRWSAIRNRRT